ncbi:MAG: hypothetical protein SFV17_05550 [Candidatus Obscuribacter sp.]|nr:hypothetical protein [Candidatus Melainabacteria bacterium]MDX1986131.1 hypothetical protein [Candidatus Obscuribacter sp.]
MECILAEILLELVPVLGMVMRQGLIMPSLNKAMREKQHTNRLLELRSRRLKELEAQGVDLIEFYRRLNKA